MRPISILPLLADLWWPADAALVTGTTVAPRAPATRAGPKRDPGPPGSRPPSRCRSPPGARSGGVRTPFSG